MDPLTAALIGAFVGVAVGFAVGRKFAPAPAPTTGGAAVDSARMEEQLASATANAKLESLQSERAGERERWESERKELQEKLGELRRARSEHESAAAALRAQLGERQESLAEQKKSFEEQKAALKDEFKALSEKIYAEKQEALEARNQKSVGSLLEPLKTQLSEFRKRVDEVHKNDVERGGELKQQLESLKAMNRSLQDEAGNLAKALRGEKKTLGNWGEVQVEKLLELAGLQRGREYDREVNFKDGEGSNFRPDFVLYLPEGRHVIVDSKVSLGDYIESVNTDDPTIAEGALKRHVACLRSHVNDLANKDYTKLEGMNSPDFVFMFMPIETAYLAAFQADPGLFEYAYAKKIAVVTPNTLLPILRTVASLWQIEKRNRSTMQLADQAGKIHSKLAVFAETFKKVEQQLETAMGSYQKAKGQLVSGRGNLVRLVEGFRELGVKTTKSLPPELVEDSLTSAELLEATDGDGEVIDALPAADEEPGEPSLQD